MGWSAAGALAALGPVFNIPRAAELPGFLFEALLLVKMDFRLVGMHQKQDCSTARMAAHCTSKAQLVHIRTHVCHLLYFTHLLPL